MHAETLADFACHKVSNLVGLLAQCPPGMVEWEVGVGRLVKEEVGVTGAAWVAAWILFASVGRFQTCLCDRVRRNLSD